MRKSMTLGEALAAFSETRELDFKRSFDPAVAAEFLEVLKDAVAMANSGGGTLLIGVCDDGNLSNVDISAALNLDPAILGDKIFQYTDRHFDDFRIIECEREGVTVCAILVGPADYPLVFARPGTYPIEGGKQKTAFGVGTVYFRHGAKSEPGTSEDLRLFVEDRIEQIRRSWLDGITRLVESPAGSQVFVLPPEVRHVSTGTAMPIRLVDDKSAPAYVALPVDLTHPYRQKDVRDEINKRLEGRVKITARHIFCARKIHNIDADTRFCFTQKFASPRYSEAFVEWLTTQYEDDPTFFERVRTVHDQPKHADA